MTSTDPDRTALLVSEDAATAALRRGVQRIGARLRDEMQPALERILAEAARAAGSGADDPALGAASSAITRAARDIAARLSRFEETAIEELGAGAETPAGAPAGATLDAPAGTEEVHGAPYLTRALAGELSHLARQVDPGVHPPEAARLRPRLRRAARLANLWLTTSVGGAEAAPGRMTPARPALAAGALTATSGRMRASPPAWRGRGRAAAPPPSRLAPEPAAYAAHAAHAAGAAEAGAAAVALAARMERLDEAYRHLEGRFTRRDSRWRYAIHELRNAAHAFASWGFVLRRSEVRDAPWYAPLVRAAEGVIRRAEEALASTRGELEEFEVRSEPVDLAEAAHLALELVRPLADMQNLALAVVAPSGGRPVHARADHDRVQQILHNLLRNAIEATPAGGSIALTVREGTAHAVIEVEDSGPGLPADVLAALVLGRAPGDRPGRGGPGVGLRLSQELAHRMGGSLTPEPGDAGARLSLRLPRNTP